MNSQAQLIIDTARRYLGVRESPPHSNNVIFNTVYYGRAVSGSAYPWCAVFVWYVFREAGLSHLYFGGNRTAHCATLLTFARRNGLFHASDYRPGDLALFDWSGRRQNAQHIGIVTRAMPTQTVTIEGNTAVGNDSNGGQVMERVRNNSMIIGVYRPEYEEDIMDINEIRRGLTAIAGTGTTHSEWSADAIDKMRELGIFNGDGDGNFGWGQLVTREALAQALYNLLSEPSKEEVQYGD